MWGRHGRLHREARNWENGYNNTCLKTLFSNFKAVSHDKICPPKRRANEVRETALENQVFSIDVDSFLLIIKKQWGNN